jgi:diguanylate cyclase (GGDEF)-like protein/PAS domain S-box-containing protein
MVAGGPEPPRASVDPDAPLLATLLRELPDVVVVIDAEARVLWGNRAAEQLFSRTAANSVGMSGLELVHPEDIEFVLVSLTTIQGKGVGTPIEVRLHTPSGWRLMELIGAPVPWFGEGAILLTLRDLTERRRYELVHGHDTRFRALVQSAAALTMLVSPSGVVESCSGAITRLLGHDPETVEGRPLVDLVAPDDRPALESTLDRTSGGAQSARPVTVTVNLLSARDTTSVPFELALVNLVDDPTVGGYVVTGHDVTDRRRLEEALSYQAFHDPLTGLGNRALFRDRLVSALARSERTGRSLALLFVDVDNLKMVNDRLGHDAGDALLRRVSERMLGCLRNHDVAARLGGDEFGIIVEDLVEPDGARVLASRILDSCRKPAQVGSLAFLTASVSIGVTLGGPGTGAEALLRQADRAMYAAKQGGRDRYTQFSEDDDPSSDPESSPGRDRLIPVAPPRDV